MPNPEARVDPASEEEFLAQLYRGGELLASGKVTEAKDHLERAYTLHPRNEKAQNLLGLTYFKLGIYDRAAQLYEKLVLDNPADPTLRVNLGLVYLKANDLPRCIREFETATDLSPEHKKAQNYLGLALAQAGEYSRAREHFVLAGSDAMAEKMAKAVAAGAPPPQAVKVPVVEVAPPPPPPAEDAQIEMMSEDERPEGEEPPVLASLADAEEVQAEAVPDTRVATPVEPAELAPPPAPTPVDPAPTPEPMAVARAPVAPPEYAPPPPPEFAPPPPPEVEAAPAQAAPADDLVFAEDEGPHAPPMPEDVVPGALEVAPPDAVQVVDEMPVVEGSSEVPVEVFNQAELPTPHTWEDTATSEAAPVATEAAPVDQSAIDTQRFPKWLDGESAPAAVEAQVAEEPAVDPDQSWSDVMAPSNGANGSHTGMAQLEAAQSLDEAMQGHHSAMPPVDANTLGSTEARSPEFEMAATQLVQPEGYDAWAAPVVDAATPVETSAVDPAATWGEAPATEPAMPSHMRDTVRYRVDRVVTAQPAAVPGPPHVDFVPDDHGAPQTSPGTSGVSRLDDGMPVEDHSPDPAYSAVAAPRLAEVGPSLDWSRTALSGPFLVNRDGLALQVRGELLSRLVGLVAVVGQIDATPEMRRMRGRASDQPFGEGATQMQRVVGHGILYLEPGRAAFHAINLDEDAFYVREELVFAFEEAVAFENGRLTEERGLSADMIHLKGQGQVLLRLEGALKTMAIPAGAPMVVPLARLVGWYGIVTPRLKGFVGQGAVELNGEGYALLVAPS